MKITDKKLIYLDNNATTAMSKDTINAMVKWCNMGNPSAGYAQPARDKIKEFQADILTMCGVGDTGTHRVIFTSGASEANCHIIRSAVMAYRSVTKVVPHVVASAIEHKSVIACLESLAEYGHCEFSLVIPDVAGQITPANVSQKLRVNTCLVVVMSANNETGVINEVAKIGNVCHRAGIPYHCDMVQSFGKFAADLSTLSSADSCSVSFHKFGGPPGIGAIVIREQFLTGWTLPAMISGSQNDHLRGGTENLPGIAASSCALRENFVDRIRRNTDLSLLKVQFLAGISLIAPVMTYFNYRAACSLGSEGCGVKRRTIVVITPEQSLPHTVLIAIVDPSAQPCNVKMKQWLESHGVIISVGSACNTASAKASHVLYALGADNFIRKGALRISIGDHNTSAEIDRTIALFAEMLKVKTF